MEQLQLELGTPGHLLQFDYSALNNLTMECWLKMVWKFAWANKIEIRYTGPALDWCQGQEKMQPNLKRHSCLQL
jgi:hypothetical protein